MSFEEEFDKIIRQKSEEVEFPFNEKNWEQASSMIDADRKAARVLKYNKLKTPLVAISIGLIGIVATVYYSGGSLNTESNIAENKNISPIEFESKQSSVSIASETVEAIKSETKQTTVNITDKASIANSITSQKALTKQPAQITPKTENLIAVSANLKESNPSKVSITPKLETEDKTENVSNLAKTESAILNSEEKISDTKELGLIENSEIPVTVSTPVSPKSNASSHVNTSTESDHVDFESEESLSANYLVSKVLQLETTIPEKQIEQTQAIALVDTDYYKHKSKTHFLNFELGTAYLSGWNTSGGMDAKGFDYFGGFNYGVYLNNKLNVSIGLQGYNISHMSQPFYESSHKDYDFGSTSIYTVVTCIQMYYAAIPLKFNYQVNHANQIGLGVNVAYLFNTSTNTESYYFLDNSKITTATSHSNYVFENMNQYNCMITASYQRQLGKRFGLGVEVIYGLSDLFQKSSHTAFKENTMGLRLALHYTIFDK